MIVYLEYGYQRHLTILHEKRKKNFCFIVDFNINIQINCLCYKKYVFSRNDMVLLFEILKITYFFLIHKIRIFLHRWEDVASLMLLIILRKQQVAKNLEKNIYA